MTNFKQTEIQELIGKTIIIAEVLFADRVIFICNDKSSFMMQPFEDQGHISFRDVEDLDLILNDQIVFADVDFEVEYDGESHTTITTFTLQTKQNKIQISYSGWSYGDECEEPEFVQIT